MSSPYDSGGPGSGFWGYDDEEFRLRAKHAKPTEYGKRPDTPEQDNRFLTQLGIAPDAAPPVDKESNSD